MADVLAIPHINPYLSHLHRFLIAYLAIPILTLSIRSMDWPLLNTWFAAFRIRRLQAAVYPFLLGYLRILNFAGSHGGGRRGGGGGHGDSKTRARDRVARYMMEYEPGVGEVKKRVHDEEDVRWGRSGRDKAEEEEEGDGDVWDFEDVGYPQVAERVRGLKAMMAKADPKPNGLLDSLAAYGFARLSGLVLIWFAVPNNKKHNLSKIKGTDRAHPYSRKAQQARRVMHREERIEKAKSARDKERTRQIDRILYFKFAVSEDLTVATMDDVHEVVKMYIERNDDEITTLKSQLRKGRPKPPKLEMLEQIKANDQRDYENGTFELPDIIDTKNLRTLRSWEGDHNAVQQIKMMKIRDPSAAANTTTTKPPTSTKKSKTSSSGVKPMDEDEGQEQSETCVDMDDMVTNTMPYGMETA
ncbi:hypothetical protein HK102_005049 [Quaeritorhiza haematococci]|nr:hypothetical protein HK102_005049 [Quaeritorhiza haematococci]